MLSEQPVVAHMPDRLLEHGGTQIQHIGLTIVCGQQIGFALQITMTDATRMHLSDSLFQPHKPVLPILQLRMPVTAAGNVLQHQRLGPGHAVTARYTGHPLQTLKGTVFASQHPATQTTQQGIATDAFDRQVMLVIAIAQHHALIAGRDQVLAGGQRTLDPVTKVRRCQRLPQQPVCIIMSDFFLHTVMITCAGLLH
jgi:hypothetical protein